MTDNLTIEDLEKHSGLSTRTLHYYMTKGLLPGPETRGKYASYTQEHLDRLDLILILKEMRLSLYEIKVLLDQLTPDEIRQYRDNQSELLERIKRSQPGDEESSQAQRGSALEYLKGLDDPETPVEIFNNLRFIKNTRVSEPQTLFNSSNKNFNLPNRMSELWRRVIIADGIELHIRESGDEVHRYTVDRLIKFALSLRNQFFSSGRESKDEK